MVLKGEGLHLERRWKEASIEVVQQQRGPSFMSDRWGVSHLLHIAF